MTFDIVMNEIHKWCEKITRKYAGFIKYEIEKDEKNIFIVNFNTNRFMAQLVVDNIGFHPYRFVSFVILDMERDIYQQPSYVFYDDENNSVSDIIAHLNFGIEFIGH